MFKKIKKFFDKLHLMFLFYRVRNLDLIDYRKPKKEKKDDI